MTGKINSKQKLKGKIFIPDFINGASAYEIAVANGFEGTEQEWLESLKGDVGPKGDKGADGQDGAKGEKGDAGKDAVIEQSYSPASENAQSGKAVAQAMSTRIPKPTYNGSPPESVLIVKRWDASYDSYNGYGELNDSAFDCVFTDGLDHTPKSQVGGSGWFARRDTKGNLYTGNPVDDEDCANKKYVDNKIANINTNGSPIDLTDYVKKEDISAVATTGDYNDLKNIPESVQVDTDLTVKDNNGLPSPIISFGDSELKQTLYWNGKKADKFYNDTDGATADSPIIINTAEELAYVASATYENTYGKYFKIADGIEKIVLQSETYGKDIVTLDSAEAVRDYFNNIIGSKKATTLHPWVCQAYDETKMCFAGHFDGNGVEIYGMYASDQTVANSGIPDFNMAGALFGIIDSAVISNVAVKNSYINLGKGSENWHFGLIAAFAKDKDTAAGDNISYINHCIVANNYIYKQVNDNGFNHSGVILGGNLAGNYIIQKCLVYGNMATGNYSPSIYYDEKYDLSLIGKTRNGIVAPDEFAKEHPDWVFNDGTNDLIKTVLEDSVILGTPPYAYCNIMNNVTLRVLTCDEDINCLKNVYVDWNLDNIPQVYQIDGYHTRIFSPTYFLNETGSGKVTKAQLVGDEVLTCTPNLMWGIDWFLPGTFENNPVPFDYLKLNQGMLFDLLNFSNKNLLDTINKKSEQLNNELVKRMDDNDAELSSELNEKIEAKSITSKHVSPSATEYLEFNNLYFLISNSGGADITLYDSNGNRVTDGGNSDGSGSEALPAVEMCMLIMPKNIVNDSDKIMCYWIGFTSGISALTGVKSRHFYLYPNQKIYCKQSSEKNISVFKIGL